MTNIETGLRLAVIAIAACTGIIVVRRVNAAYRAWSDALNEWKALRESAPKQADSLPSTPPKTVRESLVCECVPPCVPDAVKCNGRFYKRYDAPKYGDSDPSPEYKLNNVVFEANGVLTYTKESYDIVRYRGAYFVRSKAPIETAVDLGEIIPSVILAPNA